MRSGPGNSAAKQVVCLAPYFQITEGNMPGRMMLSLKSSALFLRICEKIAAAGTFKANRRALRREGHDPANSEDTVSFNDRL